jgi:hypothetical protein
MGRATRRPRADALEDPRREVLSVRLSADERACLIV